MEHPLAGKTGRTLLVMLAVLAIPYASPRLRALRVVPAPWDHAPAAEDEEARAAAFSSLAGEAPPPAASSGEQALPASENTPTVNNALPAESAPTLPDIDPDVRPILRTVPIEDASGHALDAFFARLRDADDHKEGAVARVAYYGDSTIASDYISGTVRRRLQSRFGDAGHGFILVANPWEWYFQNDVLHASSGEWKASKLAGPITTDGYYGLGGVSFTSYGGGFAWFGTSPRTEYGRAVSRFDVFYLEQPNGGDLELEVKGQPPDRFSTRADAKASRVHSVHVPDGEAKLAMRAMGGGPVRLFGVALERDRPGVVVDALGSHAAMAVYWQRQDEGHWRDQLALRDPALIVFQYGTNESDLWRFDRDEYETALAGLFDELHRVAPKASLLVVSPLDRAERRGGALVSKRIILDLVAIQRRVALAHGAAFWCTFDAMGGEGSMARWVRAVPQLAEIDLTHPSPLGAEVLGDMLSDTIVSAYTRWRASAP